MSAADLIAVARGDGIHGLRVAQARSLRRVGGDLIAQQVLTAGHGGVLALRAPQICDNRVVTIDDVVAFIDTLPDVVVGTKWGTRTWMVGERGFAWQRPFSKADLKRFGDEAPPTGEILAVVVENLDAKDALLAIAPPGFFTIPHFNGYAAVLIELRAARKRDVRAAIKAAWQIAASALPKRAKRARKR